MVVIDNSWVAAGRNYRAALELCLVLERVVNQFVELLWRQEFVQDHTLCPYDRRRVQDPHAAARVKVAWLRPLLQGNAEWSETSPYAQPLRSLRGLRSSR